MKIREVYHTMLQLYRNRYAGKQTFVHREMNSLHSNWLRELQVKGAVMIPNFLSDSVCDEIISSIEFAISDFKKEQDEVVKSVEKTKFGWERPAGYSVWKDEHESDFRVFHAEKLNSEIQKFYSNQDLLDIGSEYLQTDLHMKFTMCGRLEYKPENLGSGGGWHRDMKFRRGFKAMVYLTDVDENSGPFQFLPGSSSANYHLTHVLEKEQYQYTHKEVLSFLKGDESKIMSCVAPKGTLLIFETNLIHRGKPIDQGRSRFAMTNYYNM